MITSCRNVPVFFITWWMHLRTHILYYQLQSNHHHKNKVKVFLCYNICLSLKVVSRPTYGFDVQKVHFVSAQLSIKKALKEITSTATTRYYPIHIAWCIMQADLISHNPLLSNYKKVLYALSSDALKKIYVLKGDDIKKLNEVHKSYMLFLRVCLNSLAVWKTL